MKLLALLNAIGSEGMKVLELVRFDLNSQDAINHFKNCYNHARNELGLKLLLYHASVVRDFWVFVASREAKQKFKTWTRYRCECASKEFATSIALTGLRNDLAYYNSFQPSVVLS